MKLVILDGTHNAPEVAGSIEQAGMALGAEITCFRLAEIQIAPCLGDFECWVKTPGRCRTKDMAREITQAIHDATLVVFLSPVVFGSHASPLKKLIDRLIPLTDAFFHEQAGLTRHQRRYARYPAMLFIGLSRQPNEETKQLFAELAGGNAINLQAPWFRSLLIHPEHHDWQSAIEQAVSTGLNGGPGDPPPLPDAQALAAVCAPDAFADTIPSPTATLLIGSARPKGASTSESLARALAADLEKLGVRTKFAYAISFVKPGKAAEQAILDLLSSDLLIVAAPLYVDGLPALVMRALEQAGEMLHTGRYPLRKVVGLLNCGFPEAVHNRTALRILRAFAHDNRLLWAGGLAMGAGEILHGKPLTQAPFIARAQIRALRRAAGDLAAGRGVSSLASADMARPLVPPFVFRWLGKLRWRRWGRAHGIGESQLHARPLASQGDMPAS